MRIIAGEWRGRTIVAPPGETTRPTADRTRETLFSMLLSRLGSFEGLRVADLFAGSGALGLEALSRGAAHVTFVERDAAALAGIKDNLKTLGGEERADIIVASALSLPPALAFGLILADPPYAMNAGKVLAAVAKAKWLGPGGWLAVETTRKQVVEVREGWTVDAARDTGSARLTLLRA